jgi:uncharacterized membrane protein
LTAAVAFALCSLLLAGLNDVVFKRHSRVERSMAIYVMGMGIVWTVLQLGIVLQGTRELRLDAATLGFGLGAGVLVALSNMFLVEALRHVDVSLASTIYRLNTIAVVIMAVALLGEPLTARKSVGVLLGLAAIVLLFERRSGGGAGNAFMAFFSLVVLASLLRACFGVVSRAAVLHGVDLQLMLLLTPPVWIAVGGAYAVVRGDRLSGLTRAAIGYAVVSGALICGIANFLMLALERGEASVVVPIANMSFVVAMLLSVLLGMERLTGRKMVAGGLACAAIVVLARA